MFPRILKQAFWDCYDHLGRLLLLNLLLVFVLLPLAWMSFQFVIIATESMARPAAILCFVFYLLLALPVLGTPWMAGLFHFGSLSSEEKDPSLREFFRGWKACGGRIFRTLLLLAAIAGLLVLNFWFYLFSGLVPESLSLFSGVLGGLSGWLLLALGGVAAHALPLAARTQQSAFRCVRMGTLLLLRFPAATFLVVLTIIAMLILGTALRFVGIVIYGFVLPVMIANSLHDVCGDVLEAEEARSAESDSDRPASWREIQEDEQFQEERRLSKARYNRGLRDILRPWEM